MAPEDPDALAAAIRSVLDDRPLAARLAEAGRAEYEAEYAEAPVVRRWRQALGRHGGAPDVRHRRPGAGANRRRRPTRRRWPRSPARWPIAARMAPGISVVGRTALVQTRLAIIDLASGDQPLFAGAAALVANGEVYNYRELREDMPEARFATQSDCEPPLHLWLRDGLGLCRRAARHVSRSRSMNGRSAASR